MAFNVAVIALDLVDSDAGDVDGSEAVSLLGMDGGALVAAQGAYHQS